MKWGDWAEPDKSKGEEPFTAKGNIEVGGKGADPDINSREHLRKVVSLRAKVSPGTESNDTFCGEERESEGKTPRGG